MIHPETTPPSLGVFLHINVYIACNTSGVPAILHIIRFLVARLESKNGDAKHHGGRHRRKTSFPIPLLPVFGPREARSNILRVSPTIDIMGRRAPLNI